jgi:hypothetical protein
MTTCGNDNNNGNTMFNKGIKMAINAYEMQVNMFLMQIKKLNEQVQEKHMQFNKLQEICAKLLNDKKNYEMKLNEHQVCMGKLKERVEELVKENVELKTIKTTILNDNDNNDKFEMVKENKMYPKSTNVSMGNIFVNYKQSFPRKLPNSNSNSNSNSNTISPHTVKERNKIPISFRKHISTSVHVHSGKKVNSERREQNKYCQSEGKVYKPVKHFDNKYEKMENKCEKENVDFFKKCRKEMNKNDYMNLIDVVHLYNHKSIGKDVMYQKIKMIFNEGNYKELFNDFNNLFTQAKG